MENIFKRLEFVIKESEEVTKHFNDAENEEVLMFCMCMLDRLNLASESIKILMNNFLTNTKVEYSCGIIIRCVLLDYLIVLNAMEVYEKNLENKDKFYSELKKYCLMMLCDSVRHTLEYFESLENEIPNELLKNMYTNLVAMNPNCFESYANDGTKPIIKTKEYKSPNQLFKTLVTSEDLKQYKNIYQAYLFYSKYDHFGQMFYGLSRRKPLKQLENIDDAITAFPRVLLFTVAILEIYYVSNKFLTQKRESIMAFIDNIDNIKPSL